ncbi:MAG: hypothetical protein ACT4R6_01710 [Gemmatimonadaceae bacterium]
MKSGNRAALVRESLVEFTRPTRRFRWLFVAVPALAALPATSRADAQLVITRNLVLPTAPDSASGQGFLPRVRFFGELQRGFGSAGDEHTWALKLGGIVHLFHFSERTALIGTAAHELTANPHNSIGFNPRGAYWEENVLFVRRATGFDLYIGGFHRCRHEVDNYRPPDDNAPTAGYEPTARLVSLSGPQVGAASREFTLGSVALARWFVRLERYLITTDGRTPRNVAAPYWKDARHGLALGGRVARRLAREPFLYARAWASLVQFGGRQGRGIHNHWHLESGARIVGDSDGMDLYVAVSHNFDDLTLPIPRATQYVGIGVRFTPQTVF